VTVVPSKATRKHLRGVVKTKGNGKTKILRADGTEEELDGEAGEAGDDLVFIVKSGRGGAPSSVTNSVSEDDIVDRIDALTLAAEDNPELADGLAKLRGKVNDKRLERLEALVESGELEDQDLIDGALTKARGKSASQGSGSSGDGDSSDSPGNGNSGNAGGGNSGNSGGGNSGNSGGSDSGNGNSGNSGGADSGAGNSGGGNSGGGNSGNSGGDTSGGSDSGNGNSGNSGGGNSGNSGGGNSGGGGNPNK
jgi:hypothetical protein